MLPKKKVLLVIGNGFDLDLGLRTSYSDFVDSSFFRCMVDQTVSNPVDIIEGIDAEKMQLYPNGLATYVKEKKEHNNWVDLEECIRDYCERQVVYNTDRLLLRKEIFAMRYMLFHYLWRVVDYKFEERNAYFKNHVAYKLIKRIVQGNVNYKIWNFNYTFTCEKIMERLHVESKEIEKRLEYIHGKLYKEDGAERWPIVLGSNSTTDMQKMCPSAIKSNTPKYFDRCRAFKENMSNAEVIVFMGHSMGSTDSPYFKEILSSNRLKTIVVVTKSENSLDAFQSNMNVVTDFLYGQKKEAAIIQEISYTSESYYEPYHSFNAEKSLEFEDVMDGILH